MFGQLMLHQTLTISSSSAPYSSPLRSALRSPSTNSYCSQVEETGMEALNSCLRLESVPGQQQQAGGVLEEEMVWAVEDGSLLLGEEFSVDDLLNFELVENEKDAEEEEEEEGADGEVGVHKQTEGSNAKPCSASSASSSSLSFDLPPALFGLSLPAHDAEEFEWVSLIMDDSLSEFPSCSGAAPLPLAPQRQDEAGSQPESCTTKGPSFVSPSVCILSTEAMVPVKAKRSKRPRSAAAAPWSMSGPLPFAESSSDSTITTTTTSSSSSLVSSCSTPATSSYLIHDSLSAAGEQSFLLCDMPPPLAAKRPKQKPKKRGRKPKPASSSSPTAPGERRCSHCGAQKTPQWRAGPLGAKTLCNACGVRFKSGRLLPEYRPVCSPTFVSHIHSNCHRKVLEMRRKKESELPSAAAPPVPSF